MTGFGRSSRLAAAALFLGATTLLPAVHLAFHDRDHDHAGGTIRYERHRHETPHRHGNGKAHTHGKSGHRHAPPPADQDDPRHGDGSLAHFALALGESGSFAVASVSEPLTAGSPILSADPPAIHSGFHASDPARGPPAS